MATLVVPFQPAAGRAFVDLTSWAGDATFAVTPVATDQVEGPDTLTLNADGTVTGADGAYTLHHIQAANGTAEGVGFVIGAGTPPVDPPAETSSASVTVPFVIGAAYSLATLAEGFDPYNFQQQPVGEPAAGWQLITDADYGYFDSQGNFFAFPGDLEGLFDIWFIDLAGTIYKQTMKTDGLAIAGESPPNENPAADNWPFNKYIKYRAEKTWTWGPRHPKTNMRVRMFNK